MTLYTGIVPNLSTNALGWPKKESSMNSGDQAMAILMAAVVGICVTLFIYTPQVVSCLKRIAKALEKEPTKYFTVTFVAGIGYKWDDMKNRLEELDNEVNKTLGAAHIHSVQDRVVDVDGLCEKRLYRTVLYSLPSPSS